MLDITFGILNYNPNNNPEAENALKECITSLYYNRNSCLANEVYVIDQGSVRNKQQHVISSHIQDLRWRSIFLDKNVGISRGINLLSRIARGRYICLVTSDTEFSPGLDVELIKVLEENPNIWQVCPASDNASSDYQRQGFQPNGLAFSLAAQELTIQMWPRKVFDTIGYFDERWKACFENLDYGLRIFLAGGNIAVTHDVACHHELGMTIKSGARNSTYDGYIHMPNGFDQGILHQMWQEKWAGINWDSLYLPPKLEWRIPLLEKFKNNIYLDYVQDVSY